LLRRIVSPYARERPSKAAARPRRTESANAVCVTRFAQAAIGWVSGRGSSVRGQPQTLQLKQYRSGMMPAAGMVRTNVMVPSHTAQGTVEGIGGLDFFGMGRPLDNLE
jgi:hypothetical protein